MYLELGCPVNFQQDSFGSWNPVKKPQTITRSGGGEKNALSQNELFIVQHPVHTYIQTKSRVDSGYV